MKPQPPAYCQEIAVIRPLVREASQKEFAVRLPRLHKYSVIMGVDLRTRFGGLKVMRGALGRRKNVKVTIANLSQRPIPSRREKLVVHWLGVGK